MYVGDDGFCFLPLGGTTSPNRIATAFDSEQSLPWEVTIHLIVPNIHQCLPRESAIDIKKPPSSQRGLSFKTYQPCLGYALNDQFRWIRTLWCEAVSSLEILQCFFHLRFIVVVNHHQWLTLLHLRANLLDF